MQFFNFNNIPFFRQKRNDHIDFTIILEQTTIVKIGFYVLSIALIFSLSNCAKTSQDIPNTTSDSVVNSVILSASVQNNTAAVQATTVSLLPWYLRDCSAEL